MALNNREMIKRKSQIFKALRDFNNERPHIQLEHYPDDKAWARARAKGSKYKNETHKVINQLEEVKGKVSMQDLTETFGIVFGGYMSLKGGEAQPKEGLNVRGTAVKILFKTDPSRPLNKYFALKSYCNYLLLTRG